MYVTAWHCAVPEKIHTHPMEGHWKFLGRGGVLKAKILGAKYEAKLEFPGGGGGGGGEVHNKKTSGGGGARIFSETAHCNMRSALRMHINN